MSRTAADSTMLRTVNRLMALSLGTARAQFEQRTKLTWPRPFLLRPPFLLFLVCHVQQPNVSQTILLGQTGVQSSGDTILYVSVHQFGTSVACQTRLIPSSKQLDDV
jgi:hypothetical protein